GDKECQRVLIGRDERQPILLSSRWAERRGIVGAEVERRQRNVVGRGEGRDSSGAVRLASSRFTDTEHHRTVRKPGEIVNSRWQISTDLDGLTPDDWLFGVSVGRDDVLAVWADLTTGIKAEVKLLQIDRSWRAQPRWRFACRGRCKRVGW